jgi:hypothetical protein
LTINALDIQYVECQIGTQQNEWFTMAGEDVDFILLHVIPTTEFVEFSIEEDGKIGIRSDARVGYRFF